MPHKRRFWTNKTRTNALFLLTAVVCTVSVAVLMIQKLLFHVLRQADDLDDDPDADTTPALQELYSSWALFILLVLLIGALLTSYYVQLKRIRAVHETVISVFVGMIVGLIIRVSPGLIIQNMVSFHSTYFFNVLLPPIILNSGYELNQTNFFRNIGTILTFAFAGTFISAVVMGFLIYLWSFLGIESLRLSLVEALAVGATLSATDPVTVLAIFNSYKVDQKLYTIIFGESILNDAVAIVMFETLQKFYVIGVSVGFLTALLLKHSSLRRYPHIESCIILLMAYASYFFSNGCHMSGVVSLLFCGITLKHYAFYNMSYKAKLSTKYVFRVLAQLSENFIFIYLGMSLFTQADLVYKPLFILVSTVAVCASRYANVFPLSNFINKLGHRASGNNVDRIPYSYQVMLFWAGLRGAVGVALAAGLEGENAQSLRATILVVVVLTVIIFGGTTARMLEIMGIQTGVEDEEESDGEIVPSWGRQGNDRVLPRDSLELQQAVQPADLTQSFGLSASDDDEPVVPEGAVVNTAGRFSQYQRAADMFNDFIRSSREDQAQWLIRFDENVLKPVLIEQDILKRTTEP
ncbi:CPA1 sodium ion/proton antiporter [Schizosaccharomyces japonicus yFS275]|uniref:CPA1 sodium ion/proton antiporter n=1 Tax=Schizosaccharomyces japonicus (strain yFS275 / FY16936) TaxID=402676 RepID=B6K7A8_SCHJY|nr:CPA1 sodium ion/proton antiporter [Schizosaccharomyces japonicus yFS275]EEB09412.1 CPA1 sodium ion/proton antiporter [Schizosaccharomyces japonicus yFS275]